MTALGHGMSLSGRMASLTRQSLRLAERIESELALALLRGEVGK